MNPSWILIYLGLGAVLLELVLGVATGFDLILVGSSLIIGGIVGNLLNNWQIGLVVSIILATLYMAVGRKLVKHSLAIATHKTNIDTLVGKTAHVIKDIHVHQAGQVKIGSEIWRAEALTEISKGKKVTVVSVEGVTVNVAPMKGA